LFHAGFEVGVERLQFGIEDGNFRSALGQGVPVAGDADEELKGREDEQDIQQGSADEARPDGELSVVSRVRSTSKRLSSASICVMTYRTVGPPSGESFMAGPRNFASSTEADPRRMEKPESKAVNFTRTRPRKYSMRRCCEVLSAVRC